MSIAPAKTIRRAGFTLLEITLAVAILAMMSLAIYRFVQSNITVLRVSSEAAEADARYDGLRDLLTAHWQSLAPGAGNLLGDSYKLADRSRDEVRWSSGAGPGVLTRYAPGEYAVILRLKAPAPDGDRLDLGLSRKPKSDSAATVENETWVPLIENVESMQVRYFDPRLNTWLDKWADTISLPRLIKVTLRRSDSRVPWEAIIPLGRTPL